MLEGPRVKTMYEDTKEIKPTTDGERVNKKDPGGEEKREAHKSGMKRADVFALSSFYQISSSRSLANKLKPPQHAALILSSPNPNPNPKTFLHVPRTLNPTSPIPRASPEPKASPNDQPQTK